MKRTARLAALVVAVPALAACRAEPRPPLPPERVEQLTAQAEAAAKRLADALQPELKAAVDKNGAAGAIGVCGEVAARITGEVAAAEGLTLRRVALRLRNPENAPDAAERAVLERWQRGETFTYAEVADVPGGREFRWMKEIRLGDFCTQCHGTPDKVPDAVRAALAERYPKDEATGFRDGDLRGAFSVRIPVLD